MRVARCRRLHARIDDPRSPSHLLIKLEVTMSRMLARAFLCSIAITACSVVLGTSARLHAQTFQVTNQPGDDTSSLLSAFAAAQNSGGPATVAFRAGQYDFYSTSVTPIAFAIQNVTDLTILGSTTSPGTTLVFHGFDPKQAPFSVGSYPAALFDFDEIDGLTVANLTVQMSRQPYSTGVIIQKNDATFPKWVELQMDAPHSDLGTAFIVERVDDFDYASKRLTSQTFTVQFGHNPTNPEYSATVVSPGVVRLAETAASTSWFSSRFNAVTVGTGLVLMHSKYRSHFMVVQNCSDVLVSNVTIQDVPGMSVLCYNSENVTVDDLDLQPQTGRLLSGTADGIHVQDCTGAVEMKNCDMRAMGDDGFNNHGNFVGVHSLPGGNQVVFDKLAGVPYWNMEWAAGEQIAFYSQNLVPLGTATMTALSLAGTQYTATLSSAPPGGLGVGDYVINTTRAPSSVTIRDSVVEDNIAHGIRVRGSNVLVTDCVFRRNTAAGVQSEFESKDYFESHPASGLTIIGCEFDDVNRYAWATLGAISINGGHPSGAPGPGLPSCADQEVIVVPDHYLHSDITIEGNSFVNLQNATSNFRSAIWITSADGVDFNGNTFSGIGFPNNNNHSLVRMQRTINATSDGSNCVSGFAGTWLKLICSTYNAPGSVTCSW